MLEGELARKTKPTGPRRGMGHRAMGSEGWPASFDTPQGLQIPRVNPTCLAETRNPLA